jgi:hypothetical protein
MVSTFPEYTASHIARTVAEFDRILSGLEDAAEAHRLAMGETGPAHEAAYVVLRDGREPLVAIWRELEIGDAILSTVWATHEIDRERKVVAWHRSTLDGSVIRVARSISSLAGETDPRRR